MNDGYEPSSSFLTWVLSEEAPLTGSEQAEANLRRVITLTTDNDVSNRDWATFILGNNDLDTPAIRAALTARADDPDERVRAEAIRGLASKEGLLALPFIQRALEAPSATINVFEAAAIVADSSLVEPLRKFARNASAHWIDDVVRDSIQACEKGVPDATSEVDRADADVRFGSNADIRNSCGRVVRRVGIPFLLGENGTEGAAMKLALIPLALAICVPLGTSAARAEAPVCPAPKLATQQDVERYIVESEDAWAKSVATNDASVVKRILADDFIWVLDGKVVDKKVAVEWAAAGPGPFLSNEPDYVHVRFFGDTAVAQGSETWTKKGGKRGKFVWTDTWVKRADCWQIVNAQDTVVPLPAE